MEEEGKRENGRRVAVPVIHTGEEYLALEERYAVADRLLAAVRRGDTREAIAAENAFRTFRLQSRTGDELRDSKDIVLAFCGRLEYMAQLAYVHPLYIDELSQDMLREIEDCRTMGQLNELSSHMIAQFCRLIRTQSRERYMPLVRSVMNDVDFHYPEELSLQYFAGKYHVSRSYLSNLFHEQTGQKLTAYLNSIRTGRARELLRNTDLSIGDIAERCGFRDANYFARTFRRYEGLSPVQYRKGTAEDGIANCGYGCYNRKQNTEAAPGS